MTDGGSDARLERLERRLDAAESVLAIQEMKARYADLVDARFERGAAVATERLVALAHQAAGLFTEDGVWDGGPVLGVARGREEIAARLATPTLVFSRHFFMTPRIDVVDDTATARWQLLSPCTGADGIGRWMAGIEDDTYVRTDGAWRHRTMSLTTFFVSPAGSGWPKILA